MKLAVIFGTRPDSIKLGPVVAALRELGVEIDLICTNQHTTLLSGTPADTDLAGAWDLDLPSTGDVWGWVENATYKIMEALAGHPPDLEIMVQGDTMTALVGSRAAKRLGLPLHHVEAGLRSHNLHSPWPEELIRVEIAQAATWHYAPTQTSRANLVVEGVPDDHIVVTGNSGVSALARYAPLARPREDAQRILVTMHRRESRQELQGCLLAVDRWAREHPRCKVTWPVHPSWGPLQMRTETPVYFLHPLAYEEVMHRLPWHTGIVTDSGGLQEEAATLGVPCAVLRDVTDRPESIEAGVAKLFPPTPEGITAALDTLWSRQIPRRQTDCFGDSGSARRIAQAVMRHVAKRTPGTLPRFLQRNSPELDTPLVNQ